MYSDPLFNKQKEWAERGLFLLRESLPLMSPVGQYPEWTGEEAFTLGALASVAARSSESVYLLCAYGQTWDADVLSRSSLEGTLKMMYILQSRENFKQRHQEYADDLFDIALLKDHKKLEGFFNVIPNPNGSEWKPLRDKLLSPEEKAGIEERFAGTVRRDLDRKWGYSGLVDELLKSGDPMFAAAPALHHGYSMSSHIAHADYVGVSIALERDRRSAERRESVHLGHLARLIIDQLVWLQMRLMVGYRFVGHSPEPWAGLGERISCLKESFGDYYERWLEVEYGDDLAEDSAQA